MKKEVEITIKGVQDYGTHKDDSLETKCAAEYFVRNNSHYILFEETMEGFTQSTKTMIKFREGYLEMTRKGLVNTSMIFDREHETVTQYQTPFGKMVLGIHTGALRIVEAEDLIRAEIEYTLSEAERQLADCRIWIWVRPR